MKQAIRVDMKNVHTIAREMVGSDITPQAIFNKRGWWLVAEKFEDKSIIYEFLKDEKFHEDYQLRPRPEALEDLKLEMWNPVIHRDYVPEEGVTYELRYLFRDYTEPTVIEFDTKAEAVAQWTSLAADGEFTPVALTRVEVIRVA